MRANLDDLAKFTNGRLSIIASQIGGGRTATMLELAVRRAIADGLPTIFVSCETDYRQLMPRIHKIAYAVHQRYRIPTSEMLQNFHSKLQVVQKTQSNSPTFPDSFLENLTDLAQFDRSAKIFIDDLWLHFAGLPHSEVFPEFETLLAQSIPTLSFVISCQTRRAGAAPNSSLSDLPFTTLADVVTHCRVEQPTEHQSPASVSLCMIKNRHAVLLHREFELFGFSQEQTAVEDVFLVTADLPFEAVVEALRILEARPITRNSKKL